MTNSSFANQGRQGMRSKTVRMLGTHGIPGNYGGFETAAENIAKFLVRQGWRVIVYCQASGTGPITQDTWQGIERIIIPVDLPGWRGTSRFDWISIKHACQFDDVCLTFGYNTGMYNFWQRLKGIPNIINMDGLEWQRKRWGFTKQAILYINERFAAIYGNMLIADHPELNVYLQTRASARKITTITYGADPVVEAPSQDILAELGLEPEKYMTLIARPIPENSILEIVRGFSARPRGIKLVILGKYDGASDRYHQAVLEAASDEVKFVGPIYGERIVPIRYYGLAYVHGHTVGGTNPSLVEALACGNPVIAHNNKYNRWVAQGAAVYFNDEAEISNLFGALVENRKMRDELKENALKRFNQEFTWDHVAGQYENVLLKYL
jgi:glycosyltransferase involved in cell wall biosynthesis